MLSGAGEAVWEGLEGVSLLEEVSLGVGFEVLLPTLLPLAFRARCEFSAVPATMPLHCHRGLYPLELCTQLNAFFYKLHWSWCFVTVREK